MDFHYIKFACFLIMNIASMLQATKTNISVLVEAEGETYSRGLPAGVYPVITVDETKKQSDLSTNTSKLNSPEQQEKYKSENNKNGKYTLSTEYPNTPELDDKLAQTLKPVDSSELFPNDDNGKESKENNKLQLDSSIISKPNNDDYDSSNEEKSHEMGDYYDTFNSDHNVDFSERKQKPLTNNENILLNNLYLNKLVPTKKDVDKELLATNKPQIKYYSSDDVAAANLKSDENRKFPFKYDESFRGLDTLNITKDEIVEFATNILNNDYIEGGSDILVNMSKNLYKYLLDILLKHYVLSKFFGTTSMLSQLNLEKNATATVKSRRSDIKIKPHKYEFNVTSNVTLPDNVLTVINTGKINDVVATISLDGRHFIINKETLDSGVHFLNANVSNKAYIKSIADTIITQNVNNEDLGTFGKKAKKKLVKAIIKNISRGLILIINSGTIDGLNLNLIEFKNCTESSSDKNATTVRTSKEPVYHLTRTTSDDDTSSESAITEISTEEDNTSEHPNNAITTNPADDSKADSTNFHSEKENKVEKVDVNNESVILAGETDSKLPYRQHIEVNCNTENIHQDVKEEEVMSRKNDKMQANDTSAFLNRNVKLKCFNNKSVGTRTTGQDIEIKSTTTSNFVDKIRLRYLKKNEIAFDKSDVHNKETNENTDITNKALDTRYIHKTGVAVDKKFILPKKSFSKYVGTFNPHRKVKRHIEDLFSITTLFGLLGPNKAKTWQPIFSIHKLNNREFSEYTASQPVELDNKF